MSKKLDFDNELQLLEDNLNWLVEYDGLSEEAEALYRTYFENRKRDGDAGYVNEDWNEGENRRHGANSIRGTNSEMLFEALYYLVGLKIEERVTDRTRQTYGEDFVVVARKVSVKTLTETVSVKTRKHIPAVTRVIGEPDTRLYVYRDDFKPAIWRVDVVAFVDPEAKVVTTLDYPSLAHMLCDVDGKGMCTPKFQEKFVGMSLASYDRQYVGKSHTRHLGVDLPERKRLAGAAK